MAPTGPDIIYRLWLVLFPVGDDLAPAILQEELDRVNAWFARVAESKTLIVVHTAPPKEQWRSGPWTDGAYPGAFSSVIVTQHDLYSILDQGILIGSFQGDEFPEFPEALTKIWECFYEFGWARDLLLTLAPLHLAVQAWWGISALRYPGSDFEYELVRFGSGAQEPLIDRINQKRAELREVSCSNGDFESVALHGLFPRLSELSSSRALGSGLLESTTIRKVNDALGITKCTADSAFLSIQQGNVTRDIRIHEYEYSLDRMSAVLANPTAEAILSCFDEALVVIAGNERLADLLLSHWREEQTGSNQL
jgi:hypothetical protein